MNEMKELEMQLRYWVPRPPSAKLERRLFGTCSDSAEARPTFRLRWLAPATAAFVLMCVLFNQRTSSVLSGGSGSNAIVAVAFSNQSGVTWQPGGVTRGQNGLAGETLEWTNGGGWTSSNSSLRGP